MLLPGPGVGPREDAAAWHLLQHGTWWPGVHCEGGQGGEGDQHGGHACVQYNRQEGYGHETPPVLGLLLHALVRGKVG